MDPTHAAEGLPDFQVKLMADALRHLFGGMDDDSIGMLQSMVEFVEVAGGEVVVRQGGTDHDIYFVITGRLRAYGGDGPQRRRERPTTSQGPGARALSEIVRGETIGEASFITGAPRNATVVALRDSVLARISRPNLERLIAAYPKVALNMAKLVLARQRSALASRPKRRRPTNLCLVPFTQGIDVRTLGERLRERYAASGPTILLTAAALEDRLGKPGIANAGKAEGEAYRALTYALDELEARHASVLLVPDADLRSEWSRRCLRIADRVLLVADGGATPDAAQADITLAVGDDESVNAAEQVLVLLHGRDTRVPARTGEWIDRRPAGRIGSHVHVRQHVDADIGRLARLQGSGPIGLALGGGGARCFAHLGVYKALQDHHIQVDVVAGTGMGAVMGALIALDAPADELVAYAREAFAGNPTGDVSLMPVTSLIRGHKLRAILEEAVEHLGAPGIGIEDTWKTFYCVAANYSKAYEMVLRRGPLARSIRASCATPGLLPPVPVDGDLLVDGGAFNDYPTDVLSRAGVSRIIGVNIARTQSENAPFEELPGDWALAWDRVTGRRRKFRVPSLMSMMTTATMLASAAREQSAEALADLEFRVHLPSVGILDWSSFDHAVNVGYRHATKVLDAISPEELAFYQPRVVRQPAAAAAPLASVDYALP
jgi:NTE family protein